MYLELMIVMLLVKIRRDIGRQLLNDDGIPGGHVGDVVVMVGGGVGIGFARRRSVRGGGGGRAGRPRHVEFEAPTGIVVGVAGSENAALQTHAALEVKAEVVDRPSGAESHESGLSGAPILSALKEPVFLELTRGGARMGETGG